MATTERKFRPGEGDWICGDPEWVFKHTYIIPSANYAYVFVLIYLLMLVRCFKGISTQTLHTRVPTAINCLYCDFKL